jgi:hypothetical protein
MPHGPCPLECHWQPSLELMEGLTSMPPPPSKTRTLRRPIGQYEESAPPFAAASLIVCFKVLNLPLAIANLPF